jgi:hypothetical protein
MTDDNTRIKVEDLLQDPPENVFAMFQNDLRAPISSIEACVDILAEPDSEEQRKQAIEELYRQLKIVRGGLDFALDYLKKRKAMNDSSE